jgi:hypothetical protein
MESLRKILFVNVYQSLSSGTNISNYMENSWEVQENEWMEISHSSEP